MSFLKNFQNGFNRVFRRSAENVWSAPDGQGWWNSQNGFWGGGSNKEKTFHSWFEFFKNTKSKVAVTPYRALEIPAFRRAVQVLADTIASLPVVVMREDENTGNKTAAKNHYLQKLISLTPSPYYNKFEFYRAIVAQYVVFGNAAVRVFRDELFRPVNLVILPPNSYKLKISETTGELSYYLLNTKETIHTFDVLHFKGLNFTGFWGLDPISLHKETLGTAIAATQYTAEYFGNGAVLSGVLEHPGQLSKQAKDNIAGSFAEKHTGEGKRHGFEVLEEGMKFKVIGSSPNDADLTNTVNLLIDEISRITGVPGYLLAREGKMTYSSIEQMANDMIKYAIIPLTEMFEHEIRVKLFTEKDMMSHSVMFDYRNLAKGDMKAQAEFFSKLRAAEVMNGNEIRKELGLNVVDDENLNKYKNPNTGSNKKSDEKGNDNGSTES